MLSNMYLKGFLGNRFYRWEVLAVCFKKSVKGPDHKFRPKSNRLKFKNGTLIIQWLQFVQEYLIAYLVIVRFYEIHKSVCNL